LIERLKNLVATAEGAYYRLILLVGEPGSGKTAVVRELANYYGAEVINLNLALSKAMLELPVKKRALRLPIILEEIAKSSGELMLVDNIEILFDTSLMQDPLKLLQGLSRHRTVVATWGGKETDGKLIYAKPGHPESRRYDSTGLLLANMTVGRTTGPDDREAGLA
jgi:hypothetical protein